MISPHFRCWLLSALGRSNDRVRDCGWGVTTSLTNPSRCLNWSPGSKRCCAGRWNRARRTLRVGRWNCDLIERTRKTRERVIDLLPRRIPAAEYLCAERSTADTAMRLEEVWNYKFVPATTW